MIYKTLLIKLSLTLLFSTIFFLSHHLFLYAEEVKITVDEMQEDFRFGSAVSISDNYAIICSRDNKDHRNHSGSAYVFRRDNNIWTQEGRGAIYIFVRNENEWIQQSKILASEGEKHDWFTHVSTSNNYVIVGAPGNDDHGENSGSAYIYPQLIQVYQER